MSEDDHGPVQEAFVQRMDELAGFLDEHLNPGGRENRQIGFALLMFSFGAPDDGRMNYISNASRADMLKALKELIGRWERNPPPEEPLP